MDRQLSPDMGPHSFGRLIGFSLLSRQVQEKFWGGGKESAQAVSMRSTPKNSLISQGKLGLTACHSNCYSQHSPVLGFPGCSLTELGRLGSVVPGIYPPAPVPRQ